MGTDREQALHHMTEAADWRTRRSRRTVSTTRCRVGDVAALPIARKTQDGVGGLVPGASRVQRVVVPDSDDKNGRRNPPVVVAHAAATTADPFDLTSACRHGPAS